MVYSCNQSFHGVWYFLFIISNEQDVINVVDQLESVSNADKVQSTSDYIIIGKTKQSWGMNINTIIYSK